MQIQFAYMAYSLSPSRALLDELLKLLDKREEIRKAVYDGKKHRLLPGFPHVRMLNAEPEVFPTNGRLHATLAAPYTWNTRAIRSKNVLPGATVARMDVPRLAGKPDMNFTAGVWKDIPWSQLQEIQLNPLKTKTRFKAGWDAENLYVAVETELPDHRTYLPVGKDGKCWQFDCIEMVVDPWGTREKYFHFITNPVPNSTYESAVCMITDPLHPLFQSMDPSWNGPWSTLSMRGSNCWKLLITIPFSTLGKKPAKGDMWTFNVCREAFPELGSRSHEPELSCWSPCFEAFTFHEKSTFGELHFK